MKKQIEKIARDICELKGKDPDETIYKFEHGKTPWSRVVKADGKQWQLYIDEAIKIYLVKKND